MTAPAATRAPAVRPAPPLWKLALIGLVAGLLSGAFGVGGGVLIVPAIVLLLGFDQRLAHGTSLAAVVPISVSGVVGYLLFDAVDLPVAGLLVAGAAGGAVVGARLLARIPQPPLRWLFIGFMLLAAARLVVEIPDRTATLDLTVGVALALVALGVVTGVLSGLLGVGGGIFMVPVMILFLEMSDVVAKGTSLLAVIPTGILATWTNHRRGNADLRAAATMGLAGTATSILGAAVAVWLPPRTAAVLFAAFLTLVALRMALHAVAQRRAARREQADG
ncbi:sulfite exporter TauE/SafE family protein [Micromonospora sp. RP3T]|uniref:sulfite exporter TauE/SafE family protein n=1 Tax=Micromonospora sp. RP3T TaxID=2135446 RepID=UPI000D16E3C1|nr:sulfite exporter TauE/SafE family protein [Micromonospora sp. RP3T]PTA47488.1 sulfite exporter TauE/SafE family protein [Micromonospora sp. RP3T]